MKRFEKPIDFIENILRTYDLPNLCDGDLNIIADQLMESKLDYKTVLLMLRPALSSDKYLKLESNCKIRENGHESVTQY